MPPFYRIAEVALYSLLNFLPYIAIAIYLFRVNLAHRSFKEWLKAKFKGEL